MALDSSKEPPKEDPPEAPGETMEDKKGIPQEAANYHAPADQLVLTGPKSKCQANLEAIRLLKSLEAQGRPATPEEQEILSRYSGWGGIPQVFDQSAEGWQNQREELKNLLDEAEYASARASTPNAHYTPPEVIDAIYTALLSFGAGKNRILEPAMGVGNFFARLPEAMGDSTLTGVELDSVSGRIARLLYPKTEIHIQGFEETPLRDGAFDIIIGNVPFGSYQVADTRYDRYHFLIHDYFLAKCVDKLRPGGIMAVITTKGTMDKQDQKTRRYLAQRAELAGAIRLPDNAFQASANTQVTADILFLRRRELPSTEEPEWLQIGQTPQGVPVNQYYLSHPEMLLGEMVFDSSMYGSEKLTACKAFPGTSIREELEKAVSRLSANLLPYQAEEKEADSLPADPEVRNFTYTEVDGKLYYRVNETMRLVELPQKDMQRIKGLHSIRQAVLAVLSTQQREGTPEETVQGAIAHLNRTYDNFVEKFGYVTSRANTTVFREDNDLTLLSALESNKDETIQKADIFFKRVLRPAKLLEHTDSAKDALYLSLNTRHKVDLDYMAKVCGKPQETLLEELGEQVYEDPRQGWQTADEYLSGNVHRKLEQARLAAEKEPGRWGRNVEALERVQPAPLGPGEIQVQLGAHWVDERYVTQFIYDLLSPPPYLRVPGRDQLRAVYSKTQKKWSLLNANEDYRNVRATQTYGTAFISAYEIILRTLNMGLVVVKDRVDDKYVVNHRQTMIARGKQEVIKKAWQDWVFQDPERRRTLVDLYNRLYNNVRQRRYDGSYLYLPDLNPEIKLRPHQLDAVSRCLNSGMNTLLAHVVGAGKTYTMIVAAHEQLRLGLASKVAFVVPNHLTEQFGSDIYKLYSGAKVLVSTKRDFEKENRQRFLARVAMSDVEYVVIGQSQFERIPMSPEYQAKELRRQVEEVTEAIQEVKQQKGERYSVKQLEASRKGLEAKLKQLHDTKRKDRQVTFEQLGINSLFVDEAHYYKNLAIFSKMHNVAGVPSAHAQKASDLLMKISWLRQLDSPGRVVFATGTPISNSIAELYVTQKYLQPETLEEHGIRCFDEWASAFGQITTSLELTPEGSGYRNRTRFAQFCNLPELMAMWRQVADIRTAEMLNLPVPKLIGGKPQVVVCPPSQELERFMQASIPRVERIHNGTVPPYEDNMLKFTSDAKKAGLDMRLLDSSAPNNPEGKISQCAAQCVTYYQETMPQKGVQLIFCDSSTPKKDMWNVYDELKKQLVEKGIPEKEVAFIHDATTEAKREELFAKCRSGEIRFLLGSTQKCGAGTNIQDRLIALHHLDCPFRPSDIEQREGRIVRQGNLFFQKVGVFRYVTQGSFDAYLWNIVETKAKFISQVMSGQETGSRTCEDVDEAVLSYGEVKAMASGNPLIKEKMEVDNEILRLETLKSDFQRGKYSLESQMERYEKQIRQTKDLILNIQKDLDKAENTSPEFQMELEGKTFDKRRLAGEEILHRLNVMLPYEEREIGSFQGFRLLIMKGGDLFSNSARLEGSASHQTQLGEDPVGMISRLENTLKGMGEELKDAKENLASYEKGLADSQELYAAPFSFEEQLTSLLERQAALNYQLNEGGKSEGQEPAEEQEELSHTDEAPLLER